MSNVLKKRIWSAGLIAIAFTAIAPYDLINKVCVGAVVGAASYLFIYLWDPQD